MTTFVTAVATLACTVGVPLPKVKVAKHSGEPYPCMNCRCGCANAEMCWRSCCCHTQQEKLAWAKKNGVTPPSFVVAAAKLEKMMAEKGSAGSCCSSKKPSCCSAKRSCCEKRNANPAQQDPPVGVLAIQALKCHGLGVHWIFAPLSVPPADAWETLKLLPYDTVVISTMAYSSFTTQPTTPPPRIS